ncbi:LysR family transcriptional regulator, partial [Francisella tularensis subsp. holarctica]|nr:LysR family transcriptional regulator [Francisella tularensis subsp. holarctica]
YNSDDITLLQNFDFITLNINSKKIKKGYLIDQDNNKHELNIKPSYIVNKGYIRRNICLNVNVIIEQSDWDVQKDLKS